MRRLYLTMLHRVNPALHTGIMSMRTRSVQDTNPAAVMMKGCKGLAGA